MMRLRDLLQQILLNVLLELENGELLHVDGVLVLDQDQLDHRLVAVVESLVQDVRVEQVDTGGLAVTVRVLFY